MINKEIFLQQLKYLIEDDLYPITSLSNMSALINQHFENINWAGFYLMEGGQLVLGPFQGPLACSRIKFGRGVCGTAWKEARTQVVPDVEQFPGHIACSSASKSEIVVPIFKECQVTAVLDIDSEYLATFDDTDKVWLERIVSLL